MSNINFKIQAFILIKLAYHLHSAIQIKKSLDYFDLIKLKF